MLQGFATQVLVLQREVVLFGVGGKGQEGGEGWLALCWCVDMCKSLEIRRNTC